MPKSVLLCAALAFGQAGIPDSAWGQAAPAATQARSYSIPAGPLSSALAQFAAESGVLLSSDASLSTAKTTEGLSGTYTVSEGFAQLLRGTGLEVRQDGGGIYTIRPSASAPQGVGRMRGASDADQAVLMTPVVVEGDKLERTAYDLPTSVTVIGQERLDTLVSNRPEEALVQSANVSIGLQANGSFQIRGINNNSVVRTTDPGSNASATAFLNDAPVSFSYFDYLPPSLWDIESVTVLKGPQSVEQGPNSLAGALFFTYNRPKFGSKEGKAFLSYAEYDTLNVAAVQNIPVKDDVLALRLSFESLTSDGYITNDVLDIDDFAKEDRQTVRAQALLQPRGNQELQVLFTLSADRSRSNPTSGHGDATPFYDRVNSYDTHERTENDGLLLSAEITAQLSDNWRLTSLTSWNRLDQGLLFDGDQSAASDGFFAPSTVDFYKDEQILTQELRANYAKSALRAVVGLFGQAGSYDSGFDFVLPIGDFPKSITDDRTILALFGSFEYALTPRWTVGAGLRLNYEAYEVGMTQDGGTLGAPSGEDEISESDFRALPTANVSYQLTDALKVGALVSRGYRAGGGSVTYSPQFTSVDVMEYGPESTWDYELFFRFEPRGNLQINGNVFFIDWDDMQVTIPTPGGLGTTDTITLNAGSSKVEGFELELRWLPLPNLATFASVGYAKTRFKDFALSDTENLAGESFPNAPEWNFAIGLDYRAANGFFASGSFSWRDSSYAQVEDPELTSLESRSLLNARVGYRWRKGEVYLYGTNLLDDDYAITRFVLGPVVPGVAGPPRVVGVAAQLDW